MHVATIEGFRKGWSLVACAYAAAEALRWIREGAALSRPDEWPLMRERLADEFEAAMQGDEVTVLAERESQGLSTFLAESAALDLTSLAADGDGTIGLPPPWAAPVSAALAALTDKLSDPDLPDDVLLDTIDQTILGLPGLVEAMDWESLADVFEAAMGQAAVRAALQHPGAELVTALAAEAASPVTVAFAPIEEAVGKLDAKTPVASMLSSEEWAGVPVALRERAQFSARVESAQFLATVQNKLSVRLALEAEALDNGKQAFVDRDSFIRDLRALAEEEGLETTDDAGRGTVRDIRSTSRLGLIYDMQTQSAAGYARHKMDQRPELLAEWPAQRLGPSTATEPRGNAWWMGRWSEAGQRVGWSGASRTQMLALKTSPIWSALSTFDVPWSPFDWGSTRDLIDVERADAQAMGLIERDAPVNTPPADAPDYNEGLEARVDELPEALVSWLRAAFGDQVSVLDGVLRWAAVG